MRVLAAALAAALLLPLGGAVRAQVPPKPLVTYVRSGGFIGRQDSLRVLASGAAVSTRGAFRLSATRLSTLRSTLRAARFATLLPRYDADAPVADGYTYRVTYAGRTVVVEQEAEIPARLARLLDLLADLLAAPR